MFKRNVKIFVIAVCTTIMIASLTACGSKSENNDAITEQSESVVESDNQYYPTETTITTTNTENGIDIASAVNVSFVSCNGYGKVRIEKNRGALSGTYVYQDIAGYLDSSSPGLADKVRDYNDTITLVDLLSFNQIQENNRLSNGDVVELNIGVNEYLSEAGITLEMIESQFGLKLEGTLKYTVSGLPEGVALDVFEGIDRYIVYKGANGFGEIKVEIPDDYLKEINGCYIKSTGGYYNNSFQIIYNNSSLGEFEYNVFKIKKDDNSNNRNNFTSGDQFAIRVNPTSAAEKPIKDGYNFYFADVIKKYTAPDFGKYVTSYTELTQVDLETIKTVVINEDLRHFSTAECLGVYAGTLKPTVVSKKNSNFAIVVASHVSHNIGNAQYYHAYIIGNIVKKPDGTIEFDDPRNDPPFSAGTSGFNQVETFEGLEEAILNHNEYTCVKIG